MHLPRWGELMPSLPRRYCCVPGCGALAERGSGRCARHALAQYRRIRRDSDEWYKTKRWGAMRADQLRREPLCRECLAHGKVEAATECDHIVPHKGDRNLFFDPKNLQSLCKKCHSAKTVTEDGGFGRKSNKKTGPL